jgi:hypothetical protein
VEGRTAVVVADVYRRWTSLKKLPQLGRDHVHSRKPLYQCAHSHPEDGQHALRLNELVGLEVRLLHGNFNGGRIDWLELQQVNVSIGFILRLGFRACSVCMR